MNKTESRQLDRYEGAMLGVAVGDALGAPLEFMDAEEILHHYGKRIKEMIGGGWLSVEPGEVTDDTQMTLAVAEGILTAGDSLTNDRFREIGSNFLRWYGTRPKDVGNTCASVLQEMGATHKMGKLVDWQNAAYRLNKNTQGRCAGNGALMRTIYPALYWHEERDAMHYATEIGRMTHYNDESGMAILQYTKAVNAIANSDCDTEMAKSIARNAIQTTLEAGDRAKEPIKPSGYSLDSLYWAAKAVTETTTFEDALIYAVNLGGDADTIGAITGGLAGAVYGATGIPLKWINALANEPNRRTVSLFWDNAKEMGDEANVLAVRLIGLAHKAYHHGKTA